MSIESASLASGASAAAQFERAGYWNNPDAPHQHEHGSEALGSEAPAPRQVDTGDADAADLRQDASPDEGRKIDGGSDNPAGRSQRSTVDGKPVVVDPLHSGSGLEVARERTIDAWNQVSSDQLVFTTGAGDDSFGVRQRDNGILDVNINGESYEVTLDRGQELTIRAGAGDDVIEVAPNVKVNIVVEGGDGDDTITTGAGDDRIDGGRGNDTIFSGAGRDDIFGGSGDDVLVGGAGVNIIHGGDGNDEITAGPGTNFIEGGAGDDVILGAGRSDILSGGTGNDRIVVGEGASRVYAGAGDDAIENAGDKAVVHAEAGDLVSAWPWPRRTS